MMMDFWLKLLMLMMLLASLTVKSRNWKKNLVRRRLTIVCLAGVHGLVTEFRMKSRQRKSRSKSFCGLKFSFIIVRSRFLSETKAKERKDKGKKSLIIREELADASLAKLQPRDVPFPFTAVKDFEAVIRQPIGVSLLSFQSFCNKPVY